MAGVGLSRYLVAFHLFMVCMNTFYQCTHALQNHTAPSSSMSSPNILRIGVPWKTGFTEFVSVVENGGNFSFGGFCVKLFEEAMKTLNYPFHYIPVGDGLTRPNYDHVLIGKIQEKVLDAVVGDVTITAKRSQQVLFTQPFIDSGLLAVVPLNEDYISSGFALLKPFTAGMWVLTLGFFITGGLAIYLLERKKHPQFQGSKGIRSTLCGSILWFGFSSLFTNQNDIKTVLGRIVVIAWLAVTGILYSCYTANISAILTAPRLKPTLNDINSVLARQDIKLGFQTGCCSENHLTDNFRIDKQRLIALNTKADCYTALFNGEVGAIIGERPYMQSLVANHCNKLTFAGQTFTTQNWGFAFDPIHHQLVKDISIRILELSEGGGVNAIQKQWLPYYEKDCSRYSPSGSGQVHVYHFWGLFGMSGLVTVLVFLISMVRWKWKACIIPTHTLRHSGGLELVKRFQFLRRTKSLLPSERRSNFNSLCWSYLNVDGFHKLSKSRI